MSLPSPATAARSRWLQFSTAAGAGAQPRASNQLSQAAQPGLRRPMSSTAPRPVPCQLARQRSVPFQQAAGTIILVQHLDRIRVGVGRRHRRLEENVQAWRHQQRQHVVVAGYDSRCDLLIPETVSVWKERQQGSEDKSNNINNDSRCLCSQAHDHSCQLLT